MKLMDAANSTPDSGTTRSGVPCSALLEWLRGKLADAEKALSARTEAAACWQGGDSQSWREVGCKMTKAQRLKVSEREARIAVKCARDVANYKAVIEALSHSNA